MQEPDLSRPVRTPGRVFVVEAILNFVSFCIALGALGAFFPSMRGVFGNTPITGFVYGLVFGLLHFIWPRYRRELPTAELRLAYIAANVVGIGLASLVVLAAFPPH